ncbi:NAD(P)-dependent alcohol dehydrogenase [Endozoicomonas sp. G2_2]|uniref:NAD(P)-dependent alcohol dehydrogenase n=1 Tax=Endozoicomonas sp. G2_2 TaxID=2821092 RepID=UPI001ADBD0F1|nr:NAD(P)-dependent alcohol dehydrogenase [Endozoicomonas sp. G2_2]MBO9470866.1 NAD(P)-dependent alcohol dehydrogenase [Endozoicomonas sp. G2_2]
MKALAYRRFGAPEVLRWEAGWPVPELRPKTVLVDVHAGGINPKDALLRKGHFSRTLARAPLPRVSGLEIAGTVGAVGPGVTDVAVGDAVFGMTNRFVGGVHAQQACLAIDEIAPRPDGLTFVQAAAVPLAAQTALQALRDCAQLRAGQRVLINGATGGVGHFAVQIAKAMDAEVHAVCSGRNAGFAAMLGADAVYDYNATPAAAIDASFDVVFDVFGRDERTAYRRALGRTGVYVSTVPKAPTLRGELMAALRIDRRSRLVRVHSNAADLGQLAGWIEDARLYPHIDTTYPITRAVAAHRHIESKHATGKIVLDMAVAE